MSGLTQDVPVMLSGQDMGFYIEGYAKLHLFGQDYYITTTHVCLSFIMLIIIIFAIKMML